MRSILVVMRLLLISLLAGLGCGDSKSDVGADPAAGSAVPEVVVDAAPAPQGPSTHPATIEGLTAQLTALIAAAESGDKSRLGAHARALVLVEPEAWFEARFSKKKLGARLFADYEPLIAAMPQLADTISEQRKNGLTELAVEKYEKTDDLKAVGYQAAALRKMLTATPLYSVRLRSPDGKKSFHVWSFVHQDGQFRFVGKMKRLAKKRMLDDLDLGEFTPVDATRLKNAKKQKDEAAP